MSAAADPFLEVRGLKVAYGSVEALHGIDLEVRQGEIVTILGANGAGKTTALQTVSGLLRPAAGEIRFDGASTQKVKAHELVRRGIAQAPEGRRIFGTLTVRENLDLGAFTRADADGIEETRRWIYQLFPVLEHRREQLAGTLSGGEQQMLAIGRALMSRPRLLMLDEPSMGLAPLVVKEIFGVIARVAAEGRTVLLVEQNARGALRLAHRGYVLETGRIVLEGAAEALLQNRDVQRAYLGRDAVAERKGAPP